MVLKWLAGTWLWRLPPLPFPFSSFSSSSCPFLELVELWLGSNSLFKNPMRPGKLFSNRLLELGGINMRLVNYRLVDICVEFLLCSHTSFSTYLLPKFGIPVGSVFSFLWVDILHCVVERPLSVWIMPCMCMCVSACAHMWLSQGSYSYLLHSPDSP